MPKIELPPKVKCWRCGGSLHFTQPEYQYLNKPDPDCDCNDGLRYVFDDLAEIADGADFEIGWPRKVKGKWDIDITSEYGCGKRYDGDGPTPTAALLNAILKYNE